MKNQYILFILCLLFLYVYMCPKILRFIQGGSPKILKLRGSNMKKSHDFTMDLLVQNNHLNELDASAIYLMLRLQCLSRFNAYSHELIFDETHIITNSPKILNKKVSKALGDLVQFNIIKKLGRSNYVFNSDEYEKMCDKYTIIHVQEFDKIEKPEVLYHFLHILRSRNGSLSVKNECGKISYMPTAYFVKVEGISAHTVYKYNKILEDDKLICIIRQDKNNNIYARSCDAKYAIAFAGTDSNDNVEADFFNSVTDRFAQYPNIDDVNAFYRDVVRYNRIMECRGELDKILDI